MNAIIKGLTRRDAVYGIGGIIAGSVFDPRTLLAKTPEVFDDKIVAPTFRRRIEEVSRADAIAYARSLSYDDSYHHSDETRLYHDTGETLIRGPWARIEPTIGLMETPEHEIGEGRVVARVIVDDDWHHQNLWKGVNYIWFDNVNRSLRGVTIPEQPGRSLYVGTLTLVHGPEGRPPGPAQARFRRIKKARCSSCWVSCPNGCCEYDTHPRYSGKMRKS